MWFVQLQDHVKQLKKVVHLGIGTTHRMLELIEAGKIIRLSAALYDLFFVKSIYRALFHHCKFVKHWVLQNYAIKCSNVYVCRSVEVGQVTIRGVGLVVERR